MKKTNGHTKSSNGKTSKFTFIDLFAGIGGFRIALDKHGGRCVFSSEWDVHSQKTYSTNFGEIPHGDITKIKEADIPPHDVLCAGFPCQAFSISGKRQGFNDTRGTLFRDIARIAKHHKPKVLFLENVKNILKHDNGNTITVIKNTLVELGYTPFIKMLRSSDFGVPQARERVYFIAFRNDLGVTEFDFPTGTAAAKVVDDILESEPVKISCYIDRKDIVIKKVNPEVIDKRKPLQIGIINKGGQGERIYSTKAAGITLSAYGGGAASKTGAYLVNGKIRKLTPRECARMQGFPEKYIIPVPDNVAYKQFGDSVSVPVLEAIFSRILETFPELKTNNKQEAIENVLRPVQQLTIETTNA
ncbi:MAG: cytosine-specific methyltransferase, related to HhaI [Candidatus Parcubacteria bacterium]|jgi:DNA (cytosine-5)-methyltransferase 1